MKILLDDEESCYIRTLGYPSFLKVEISFVSPLKKLRLDAKMTLQKFHAPRTTGYLHVQKKFPKIATTG